MFFKKGNSVRANENFAISSQAELLLAQVPLEVFFSAVLTDLILRFLGWTILLAELHEFLLRAR